ncbi:MFS transporter [Microbacterium sp. ZW T5_56]|uniref:MFS transporter n=1 Tax=Microbacterium sp. ZW T5_56 TaxID=3378081 RepID=UPI0038545CB2
MPTPSPLESATSRRRLALWSLAVIVLSGASLEGFIIPVLPRLQQDFAVTAAVGALATVIPTVVTVIVTPIAGTLADVHGAERVLGWLVAITAGGGLLSALAPEFWLFIVGQALQGFALGIIPVGFVIIRRLLPADAVRTASGILVAMSVAGAGIGVLLAGPILEASSRAVLYGVPTGLVAVGALGFFVARGRVVRELLGTTRLDWLGAGLLSTALLLLVMALASSSASGWLSPATLALLTLTIGTGVAWVRVEGRARTPMIDLTTLRSRGVGGAVLVGVAIGASYAPMVFLVPQLIAQPASSGFGWAASPSQTSVMLAVAYGAGIVASLAAGPLSRPFGIRGPATVALLVLAIGALTGLAAPTPTSLVISLILAGIGAGAGSTLVFASAATGASADKVGVSTALITISRAIGGALATQVVAGMISTSPSFADFQAAFVIAAAISAAGAITAALLLTRDTPRAALPHAIPEQ